MSAINFAGATMLEMLPSFRFRLIQATWKREIKLSHRDQESTLDWIPHSCQDAIEKVMSLQAAVIMGRKQMMWHMTSNWKTSPMTGTVLGFRRQDSQMPGRSAGPDRAQVSLAIYQVLKRRISATLDLMELGANLPLSKQRKATLTYSWRIKKVLLTVAAGQA